jgi:23S rRNA (pseudouridine1915-N3)-methyltransferase
MIRAVKNLLESPILLGKLGHRSSAIAVPSYRYTNLRGLHVNILVVGRKAHVEPWIATGCDEYAKRLSGAGAGGLSVCTEFLKNDEALVKAVEETRGAIFALDETGKTCSSREFSDRLYSAFQDGGARVTFVIGAFDGLPSEVKTTVPLLSLGKMTWTHQMARLLLLEQIYRAAEIRKGSAYHKN